MGTFLGVSGWVILVGVVCFTAGALVGRPLANATAKKITKWTE